MAESKVVAAAVTWARRWQLRGGHSAQHWQIVVSIKNAANNGLFAPCLANSRKALFF
jgi:Ser-tRNA(Ala) deacylase AlaX